MNGDYVVEATTKLTGLTPDRVHQARETIRTWGVAHVTAELVDTPTVDAAVGAFLLADSVDGLKTRGVEMTKLLSKLRNDPDVWPTWAELYAARRLATYLANGTRLQLEAGRSGGRHADFRFISDGGPIFTEPIPPGDAREVSIEFKALGLSDDEAAFCQRARPTLAALRPKAGFVTLHAPLSVDREGPWMDRARRREGERKALRLARKLPPHTRGLSGSVVAAHGAEAAYIARLTSRMNEAMAQLPKTDDCWVAFHWSNGASSDHLRLALGEVRLPPNVRGVTLIGSAVAFPHPDIHHFMIWAFATDDGGEREDAWLSEVDPEAGEEAVALYSGVSEQLGRAVLGRIERSAGVRASIVRIDVRGEAFPRTVLVRDGSRRVLPYVLLVDPDPVEAIRKSGLDIPTRA